MCMNGKGARNKKYCRTQQFLMPGESMFSGYSPASILKLKKPCDSHWKSSAETRQVASEATARLKAHMPLLSTNPTADLCLSCSAEPCTTHSGAGRWLSFNHYSVPAVLALAWEQGHPHSHPDSSTLESRTQPPHRAQ